MKILTLHKVVVMGAGGVGKTSLVTQFVSQLFPSSYKPTVEDFYSHTITLPDGMRHTVEILDTAGTHCFPAMRQLSIQTGRAFVLVFSVDSLQSFYETINLYELITKIRGHEVPIVLVGNKSDLDEERKVDVDLIDTTRSEVMNNIPYVETSAKLNTNVKKLFHELLLQARGDGNNLKKNRTLIRRLGSFGSLPNISKLKRKPSGEGSPVKHSNGNTGGGGDGGGGINNNNGNSVTGLVNCNEIDGVVSVDVIVRPKSNVHHQLSLEESGKIKPDPACIIS